MRKIIAAGAAAMLALALGGCNLGTTGGGSSGGGSGQSAAAMTIKVGDNWSASHPMAAAIDNVFKPEVEKNTNGAIKVEVYHSGTLGNEADLWDGVRNGTIEVTVIGTVMNQEFPTMLIADWPFLYRDLAHAKAVWTGEIAADLNAQFNEKFPTTQMLAWGPNSARTFTSNKQLTSVADFQGQKLRMPSNPIHVGIATNLGASAQVIPLGELFSALETGVVDGQDNGMVTVISEGLYEVQKYVYETNHIIATLEFIASDAFMDKLPAEQQEAIKAAAEKSVEQAWDDYSASIDKDRAFLVEKGVTVTPLTEADRQVIIEKLKPLYDELYAQNAWAKELTEKIAAVK